MVQRPRPYKLAMAFCRPWPSNLFPYDLSNGNWDLDLDCGRDGIGIGLGCDYDGIGMLSRRIGGKYLDLLHK